VGKVDDVVNADTRGELEAGMLRDSAKAVSMVMGPLKSFS